MLRFLFLLGLTLNKNVFGQDYSLLLSSDEETIYMDHTEVIGYNITGDIIVEENYYMLITSSDNHVIQTDEKIEFQGQGEFYSGNISIYGNFLGITNFFINGLVFRLLLFWVVSTRHIAHNTSGGNTCPLVKIFVAYRGRANLSVELYQNSTDTLLTQSSVSVIVIRDGGALSTAFTVSVAVLVSLIYINFGCALNWNDFVKYLKKPVGPAIGFAGQFAFMPLLSYAVGYAIFPNDPAMQLGFFFTGSSPGGGGSNIWTAILDGNIDLSITMTGVSTIAAFGMIPFWIFTLGATIFDRSNLEVPYRNIAMFAIALVIPLAIGYLMQRYLQKTADFLRRTLKIFSSFLIIFIIVFAIVANLYLFEMFSWQIFVAGIGVPWLGYLGGWLLAKIFRQNQKDCLTIAIEVGLQNTGIAIFLLRFSLPQPEADLTTIAPVAIACMTPIPLFILFLIKLVKKRIQMKKIPKDSGTVNESFDSKVEETQKY